MKNLVKKKNVIAYIGKNSVLAKSFIKKYSFKFDFRCYSGDINNFLKFKKWIKNNLDINILINFAAITSIKKCQFNQKKALTTNYLSPVKIIKLINSSQLKEFNYFLTISTSHIFKKSFKKLNEKSIKKPNNYYGFTKLKLENYILNNRKKIRFKIGVARIFNYYNNSIKKSGFFVNDMIAKLRNKDKIIKINNVKTYRDFISMNDINKALFKMIKNKLNSDYNICSGNKIYLPTVISALNKHFKNKKIFFLGKMLPGLIGSNLKLKKLGWKNNTNYNLIYEILK